MSLTVNDSGHPPETKQNQEAHAVEGVLAEDEDDVQHKGQHHHYAVKHLKPVLEELQAVRKQLTDQLHHEERQKCQAQVVEHLEKHLRGLSGGPEASQINLEALK